MAGCRPNTRRIKVRRRSLSHVPLPGVTGFFPLCFLWGAIARSPGIAGGVPQGRRGETSGQSACCSDTSFAA